MGWLHHWASGVNWFEFVSIPFFTGIIGWLINWSGLWMLFSPITFHGFKVPGLREIATVIPRKLQEVPGIPDGGLGWQGIVPARAAKMGSIAVDKVIAKLGTPAEFYAQLEPDEIAAHIVTIFQPELPGMVDSMTLRRSSISVVSLLDSSRRPPPLRRSRPSSSGAASRSFSPRQMVERASPVIIETAATPPHPAARASSAANTRRPRSPSFEPTNAHLR